MSKFSDDDCEILEFEDPDSIFWGLELKLLALELPEMKLDEDDIFEIDAGTTEDLVANTERVIIGFLLVICEDLAASDESWLSEFEFLVEYWSVLYLDEEEEPKVAGSEIDLLEWDLLFAFTGPMFVMKEATSISGFRWSVFGGGPRALNGVLLWLEMGIHRLKIAIDICLEIP